ncbi:MAG TPA: YqjK-like family protein [Candidatus Acidoferrum sp.]|nr:YqjK-like family protein [Candidatus Acidoferrum sp.]
MNTKLIELAERRAILVDRARAQRDEISGALASWRSPLGKIDQGIAAMGFVKRYPVVLAGIVTLLVVFRPVRLMKWLPPGWLMWRAVRVALETGRILPALLQFRFR